MGLVGHCKMALICCKTKNHSFFWRQGKKRGRYFFRLFKGVCVRVCVRKREIEKRE